MLVLASRRHFEPGKMAVRREAALSNRLRRRYSYVTCLRANNPKMQIK